MKTYILKFNPFLILLILLNGYSTHAQDYAYNTSQGWYYEFDDEWVLCQEFHSEFVYQGGAVLGTYDDCGHAMEWDVPWDEINPEENPYNPTPSYPTPDSGNDSYSYKELANNDQEGGGVYTVGSENGPPNNNGLDEPENVCPCCGLTDHLDCECLNCDLGLKIIDFNNSNRYVNNRGTLKMVAANGNARSAIFQLTNAYGYLPDTGYPKWTGISASGPRATGSFSSSQDVGVIYGKFCPQLTGNIEIVPEGKRNLSGEITLIEEKINTISNAAKTALSYMNVDDCNFSVNLGGYIERKNVDYYADGARIGSCLKIEVSGGASFSLPEISTPRFPIIYGIYVQGSLSLGETSGNMSLSYNFDQSQASPAFGQGTLSAGIKGTQAYLKAAVGYEELIEGGIKAGVELGNMTISGDCSINHYNISLNSEFEASEIILFWEAYVASDLGGFKFTLKEGNYTVYERVAPISLGRTILYTINSQNINI